MRRRRVLESRSAALADRDMRVFQLYQRGASLFENQALSAGRAERLRAELRIIPDSKMLLLIGKDGTVKRRAPRDTDLRDIFAQIDAMPMRRAVIQEKIRTGETVTLPDLMQSDY